MKRKELGAIGEKLARDFLKKKGYKIRDTNYRCRKGEIDIVAQKKDCLVFVEVRTKASASFGSPEESITLTKREKLISSALTYMSERQDLPESCALTSSPSSSIRTAKPNASSSSKML